MAISVFRLPDLGEGLTDADVVEWYVAEGESIALDQLVVALESAKAIVDIPSPVAGRVRRHCAQPGETVATGAPLVEFEVEGDGEASSASGAGPGDRLATAGLDEPPSPAGCAQPERTSSQPRGPDPAIAWPRQGWTSLLRRRARTNLAARLSSGAESNRIHAMPAVRAKARSLGVDLASVTGTGPGGRIRGADVERATERAGHGAGETLRGVRKTMAERMALSGASVVPVTVTEDADIGDWHGGEDVTVRLIRAILAGCAASPALNAWLDDGAARRTLHRAVHVGIAADTGDGLFVPVLRNAGTTEPAALRAEVDRLRAAAAARSLAPEELDGATITLSNFGMLAGRYATPVVVPPQVAILGAGRAREEPVARGGEVTIRRRIPLSLTFDHRACTGAESSRFLAAVVADLERGV